MTRRLPTLGLLLIGALTASGCEVKFDNQDPGTRAALGLCAGSTLGSALTDDASAILNHANGFVLYRDLAQSFVSLATTDVTEIQLMLRGRSGGEEPVDGRLRVELQLDGTGVPSGSKINANAYGELEGSSIVLRQARPYTFTLRSPTRLELNRKYWVRLLGTYSTDSPTFVEWLGTKNNPEPQGQAMGLPLSSPLWAPLVTSPNNQSIDLAFRLGCPTG